MKALVFAACVLALPLYAQTNPTAAPATAASPSGDPFDDPLIKQVQARHEKAANGDKEETKALTADLEKWTKEQPKNYLLQAYLGSAYTLDSRDAWPGPGKIKYLQDGGKLLDGAVTADPANPAVRFVRAIDYYELPFFFGKGETARDDFLALLDQINPSNKSPYALNTRTKQAIYLYAGLSLKKYDHPADAKAAWVKGLALEPNSDLAAKMKIEIQKLR